MNDSMTRTEVAFWGSLIMAKLATNIWEGLAFSLLCCYVVYEGFKNQ